MSVDLFPDDPADTREALMEATYLALCEHGYADLTIERIGREFPKSPSLLYHHYGSKDELLVEFLEFLLSRFETEIPRTEHDHENAHVSLGAILDGMFATDPDAEHRALTDALIELRARAAHDEAYREHFTKSDRFFHDHLATVVRRGIDQGVFREVDPDRAAGLLSTAIKGALLQRATSDETAGLVAAREELEAYVERHLLADPPATRGGSEPDSSPRLPDGSGGP